MVVVVGLVDLDMVDFEPGDVADARGPREALGRPAKGDDVVDFGAPSRTRRLLHRFPEVRIDRYGENIAGAEQTYLLREETLDPT